MSVPSPAPAFRSNGLLGLGPGPRPDQPSQASFGGMRMDSPPPDLEEEPEDLEMDFEAEMEVLREQESGAELQASLKSMGESNVFERTEENTQQQAEMSSSFRPNGLLSFGRPSGLLGVPSEAPMVQSKVIETIEPTIFRYTNESTVKIVEPPGEPLHAVTSSGTPIAFKRRTRRRIDLNSPFVKTGPSKDLLTVPMHRLLKQLDEDKSQLAAEQMQKVYDIETQLLADDEANAPSKVAGPSRDRSMWVDKYRPKRFADLLGEDRVHREVLSWLKEWDKCVFKRSVPTKKRSRANDESGFEYYDALGRPKERILLLSGPPGFGKTTLAHIVTQHAGYHSLEVNASDDRSASTISTRVKNAIEAGSGFGSKGRPTCVVLDEIDGATGGGDQSFIRSLLKLIQDVPARKKTNTPAKPLRRPIICICNDLYAPALRPLRPFARIIRFKKPSPQLIVKRLRDICEREVMDADTRALTTLVEVTGGDVRTCLNTLQFIKSKTNSVTEQAVKSATVGSKDAGTTLNAMWNSLFVPVAVKQRRKGLGLEDGKYVNRLAFQVQACGDYDKVVMGCFEHYPNLKPIDGSLGNVSRMHHWLGFYDRMSSLVNERQEYELMAYLPYAVVPWHSHFAAPANSARPTEWPKADYECFATRTANMETVTALTTTIPPAIRSLYTSTTVLTELAPLLMRIISPPLKPVNAGIVKPDERATLSRLVEIMIHVGLRFYQEKQEDGQPQMRLEPPIDVFIHYEGKRAADVVASRYAVRTLVAQAIDGEIARRRGATVAAGAARPLAGGGGLFKAKLKNGQETDKVDIADLPATDFFGRLVDEASGNVTTSAIGNRSVAVQEGARPTKFRAVYRFNEGSSAAVRKPVKMSALM